MVGIGFLLGSELSKLDRVVGLHKHKLCLLTVPKFAQEMQWVKMNNPLTKLSGLNHTDAHCDQTAVLFFPGCYIPWKARHLELF